MQTNLSVQIMKLQYYRINIRGGGICKSVITQSKGGWLIIKLPNPPYPLDVDPMAQIEVCTERLPCT